MTSTTFSKQTSSFFSRGLKQCPYRSIFFGESSNRVAPHDISSFKEKDTVPSHRGFISQDSPHNQVKSFPDSPQGHAFDYHMCATSKIASLHEDGLYRSFTDIKRKRGSFPTALYYPESSSNSFGVESSDSKPREITVFCSNDYLGMGQHPHVTQAAIEAIESSGTGAGGTRNISGNTHYIMELEDEIAALHHKERGLVFSSGYVANEAALSTLGKQFPNAVIISDEMNHASMIHGIRSARCEKHIFKHNNVKHLEIILSKIDPSRPKIVAFESVYSMEGSIAPIEEIISVSKKYGAFTYCDEVHAVGMYGSTGAGVCEETGMQDEIDIINGTLGKAYGVGGGYIAGDNIILDMIRSLAPGYIFTTSLTPANASAAKASISFLRTQGDTLRRKQKENVAKLNSMLKNRSIPVISNPSHIIPIFIGDAKLSKKVSDTLLDRCNIYIQPINYPTVPRGTERLRITVTPLHTSPMLNHLTNCLDQCFEEFNIPRTIPRSYYESFE